MSLSCEAIKVGVVKNFATDKRIEPLEANKDFYLLVPVSENGADYFAGVKITGECSIRLFDSNKKAETTDVADDSDSKFHGKDNLSVYLSVLKHGIEKYLTGTVNMDYRNGWLVALPGYHGEVE